MSVPDETQSGGKTWYQIRLPGRSTNRLDSFDLLSVSETEDQRRNSLQRNRAKDSGRKCVHGAYTIQEPAEVARGRSSGADHHPGGRAELYRILEHTLQSALSGLGIGEDGNAGWYWYNTWKRP